MLSISMWRLLERRKNEMNRFLFCVIGMIASVDGAIYCINEVPRGAAVSAVICSICFLGFLEKGRKGERERGRKGEYVKDNTLTRMMIGTIILALTFCIADTIPKPNKNVQVLRVIVTTNIIPDHFTFYDERFVNPSKNMFTNIYTEAFHPAKTNIFKSYVIGYRLHGRDIEIGTVTSLTQ